MITCSLQAKGGDVDNLILSLLWILICIGFYFLGRCEGRTKMQLNSAWREINAIFKGEEGGDP
jgi:hypothetical protein